MMNPDPNNNTNGYLCEKCALYVSSKAALRNHNKKCHDERRFICNECGREFIGNYQYDQHLRNHRKVQCHVCGENVPEKNQIRHAKRCGSKDDAKEPKKKKEHLCSYPSCNYRSLNKYNMTLHVQKAHQTKLCGECGKEFRGEALLRRHMKSHSTQFYHCKYTGCSYKSKYTSNITKHQRKCPEGKRQEKPLKEGPVTNDDLSELFMKMDCTKQSMEVLLDWLYDTFGSHWFEKNAKTFMKHYYDQLGYQHKSEDLEFKDQQGNSITRTFTYVADLPGFIRDAIVGREVTSPSLLLSADKVIIVFFSVLLARLV